MKRIFILMPFLALTILIQGCRSDDDFSIVGSWIQESSQLYIDPGEPGEQGITLNDLTPINFIFRADGTGTMNDSESSSPFTWSLKNRVLTLSSSETTLNLTLTTMTTDRVIGEQTLSALEMRYLFDFDESQLVWFERYPNISGKITISLRRNT
jgi:hypothetical protein